MEITFDISKDELPIFLAEVDEHLQVLDNNLLRLLKEMPDAETIQTVFRSAHTIKGIAGMIGHQRMTSVTHVLENALDCVRRNSIQISASLIDICLQAVDCLRLLRDEVASSQVSNVDVDEIVASFKALIGGEKVEPAFEEGQILPVGTGVGLMQIVARIDVNSMASAARAFQLMMALQDLGEIRTMCPSQEEIETATSIQDFTALLTTDQPFEKVQDALVKISGVDEILINGRAVLSGGNPVFEQVANKENEVHVPGQRVDGKLDQQPRERRSMEPAGRRIGDLTLRMNIEHMDSLMNLVGELIADRNHLMQIRGQLVGEANLKGSFDQFSETITHLGRIIDQLQEEVMNIRMLPVGSLFNRFPRMVHDMSQKVGKQVEIIMHGEDTEMDRSMIDTIYDPLIHLIRNSVDHGIEALQDRVSAGKPDAGTITLTARHEQGRIIVTVEDDGRGIDVEKLKNKAVQKNLISPEEAASLSPERAIDLMFMAGLSTADVTTEFSGRGVGLDIVKTNIQRVNGFIQVESQPGQGTQFQISLPLTLAIVPSLLVRVRQSVFAVPMVMIIETLRLTNSDIKYVNRRPVTLLRGEVLPLISLSTVFHLTDSHTEQKYLFVVVIQSGKQQIGLIVNSLIGEEDVVVKPLGSFVGEIPGISSATILGNGQVALIIDVFNLFSLIEM